MASGLVLWAGCHGPAGWPRVTAPLSRLLRIAVVAGVESAVQIHIDRGDDLDARDTNGMTPLMIAAVRNRPAICRLLLGAGADPCLRDASGKTALEIAVASGSNDIVAILGANLPTNCRPTAIEAADLLVPVELPEPADLEAIEAAKPPSLSIDLDDGQTLDFSEWEAEEECSPPVSDLLVLGSSSAIQGAITSHAPIDSSAGWDDIDVYLPEQSTPLARVDDAEERSRLRLLLLRAIREGSVPSLAVQDLSTNFDRSANLEAEAFLTMVVNDLGAEVDERFEYKNLGESFEVFVDPEETPDEEIALDQALGAMDGAASPRHTPLQIYQREFQRARLLTPSEEIELAQAMEMALESSLDALAGWQEGLARTLGAGADALAGTRPLPSIWIGEAEPEPDPNAADNSDAAGLGAPVDEDDDPVAQAPADTSFADALFRLGELVGGVQPPAFRAVRDLLAAMRLNRRFLLELGGVMDAPEACPSFEHALAAYRHARDRMTLANLKLAFSWAKKYMFSGEPLADLAQEANIGLLKAVDRFDWRRGYRFSTYATWWIRQQIGRYVADKSRTIRLPVHVYEKVQRMERDRAVLEKAHGRGPTVDELAAHMAMPADKVTALLRIAPEPSSLDDLSDYEMIAIDALEAFFVPDPAAVVEAAEVRAALSGLLATLPVKDDRILRLRYGIGINDALTLEEIGQRYAVTRERIRQIETKAIKRLKHPARAEPFARLVLGIRTPEPLARGRDRADDGTAADVDQVSCAPARATRGPSDSASGWHLASIERILAQAVELGVRVEDERSCSSGLIWVNLTDTQKDTHRRLVRRLLEAGFSFSPGKGYWK